MRFSPRRCSPRAQVAGDLQDSEIAVEEDDVDREAHERRVHGRGGAEKDSLAARQRLAPEQAAGARERRVRQDTALAHRSSVLEAKDSFHA
jgi:hypothetical protein